MYLLNVQRPNEANLAEPHEALMRPIRLSLTRLSYLSGVRVVSVKPDRRIGGFEQESVGGHLERGDARVEERPRDRLAWKRWKRFVNSLKTFYDTYI